MHITRICHFELLSHELVINILNLHLSIFVATFTFGSVCSFRQIFFFLIFFHFEFVQTAVVVAVIIAAAALALLLLLIVVVVIIIVVGGGDSAFGYCTVLRASAASPRDSIERPNENDEADTVVSVRPVPLLFFRFQITHTFCLRVEMNFNYN